MTHKTVFLLLPLPLLLFLSVCSRGRAGGSTTYYMRADGKAANKNASTSCSSPSTAMSIVTHNGETFSPDDVIRLCDDGGDYNTSIIAPSSGTNGHPVIYKNADGDTPTIDLTVDVGSSSGWTDMGGGVYRKSGFGRILWEDDVPLKAASSTVCSDGNWYYPNGSNLIYYKPTIGTPSDHSIRTLWFNRDWSPYGLDLRNRSNITVNGLIFNRCGGGIGHGQNLSSPVSSISNITIYNNTFTRCFWAIWSNLKYNGVESDVSIYNNTLNYCNSGISAWTSSDSTPGHTQHHTRYTVTGNTISNHYSITESKIWTDVLLNSHWYVDHEAISFQDVQDSVISNNIISTTFSKHFDDAVNWTRAIFFYITNGDAATSGNSILRNHISGHFYPAIYITSGRGYSIAGVENNTIAYNLIYYGLSDRYNTSINVRLNADNPLTGTNYFVNNTVYNDSVGSGIDFLSYGLGNWIVRNNIVKSPMHVLISGANNLSGSVIFDHNIYDGPENFKVTSPWYNFTTWKNTYGFEKVGSSVSDPLFVSPGSDFHLRSGSPAIDAGVPVGLLEDHDGVLISGNPDIGAYEFNRSPMSPTGSKKVK